MKKYTLLFSFFILMLYACQGQHSSTSSTETQKQLIKSPKQKDTMKIVFDTSFLLGKFDPQKDTNFVKIDSQYTTKTNIYLQKTVYQAFVNMYNEALKDGIKLKIVSATRNFYSQKSIWEEKWNGNRLVEGKNLAKTIDDPQKRALKILRFSSMPGTSRHHWGTDIDINNLNDEYFLEGKGAEEYAWLKTNASKFGFCQPYTKKDNNRPYGYEEEKWHWSYQPLSAQYMEAYENHIDYIMINNFTGAEIAEKIDVIPKYVLGVNNNCFNTKTDSNE